MARGQHPTWREEHSGFSDNGGAHPPRRSPSRGFLIGMGVVVLFAMFLAAVGVIAAQSPSGGDVEAPVPLPDESPVPVEITVTPPEVTPDPEYTEAIPEAQGAVKEPEPEIQLTATVGDPESTSSVVQAPRTAASSWSAGPTPVPPAPAPPSQPEAARLAAEASDTYGVNIVLKDQDWGSNEASQVANVQAVISAIDRLPDTVISAVVAHPHGTLTFVSNDQGRTQDGWQPYGGHPMTYYTNSDQGPGGYHASNQVVASVGSTSISIGHEILHAYQFRNVGPDEYALALLQPEMRSFMEATGWRQTGSDEQVRQTINQPWSALDSLYVYEGRTLAYSTAGGATTTITLENPIEAFAIAGSIYYTRPSWMPLPDWPEYWAWFSANVG
jgi:hypothetical protein